MTKTVRYWQNSEAGVTIAELLVVVVVIGVVTAFALIQKGGVSEQLKRQNIARELKVALERARFDSVKRRADGTDIPQAQVVITDTSFTLSVDRNQDGVLDATDDQVTDISGQNIAIDVDDSLAFPVTVTYSQRGEASVSGEVAGTVPQFWVCNVTCAAPTAANANLVLVTATGTVNLLSGDASAPTFSAPAGITLVPATNSINNTAAVTPTPGP